MRFSIFVAFLASVAGTLAAPILETRATAVPVVVSNLVCNKSSGCVHRCCSHAAVSDEDSSALVFHDVNVAQLAICGSIAGTITQCEGSPTSTTGVSGTAKFAITPVIAGDTINVSKGRWEQSIKAAFAQCGQDIPFTATFKAGAAKGDINVSLTRT